MLHLREGFRVASFFRFTAATKSTNPTFHSNVRPLLCSSNHREPRQTFTSFHGVEKKQYFCSSSTTTNADKTTVAVATGPGTGTATAVDEQQPQKHERNSYKILAKKSLLGADGVPIATVKLYQGQSGFKYFKVSGYFSHILVPENAYPLVRAMDVLLGELATKEGQELPNTAERHQLFSTSSPGQNYDYKLDLEWEKGSFNVKMGTRRTKATTRPEYKEKTINMNLKKFHWLRHEMGKMLAEFDGSQPVDMPPKLPAHLLALDDHPHSALALPRPAVPKARKQKQQPSADANMARYKTSSTGVDEMDAIWGKLYDEWERKRSAGTKMTCEDEDGTY